MTQGIEYASVVSTDPLVVAADVGDAAGDGSGISDFFSIDNKTGKLRTRISAPGEEYAARCEGVTRIEYCTGWRSATTGCTCRPRSTTAAAGAARPTRSSSSTWPPASRPGSGPTRATATGSRPLRMDGGSVIAYKRPPYDKGGQVVSMDGGSFKETKLLENPATETVRDVEAGMSPALLRAAVRRGAAVHVQCTPARRQHSDGVPGGRLGARLMRRAGLMIGAVPVRSRPCSGAGPCAYLLRQPSNERNFGVPGRVLTRRGSATSNKRVASGGMKAGSRGACQFWGDRGHWGVARWECG
ncbi:hypothetical protein SVIOM74S_00230 [Streptomyces violarus]